MAKSTLSERYKADRAVMASELQALVGDCGATVVDVVTHPTEVLIRVCAPGGLGVFVELEQRNPCGTDQYMLSWCMDGTTELKLSDDFPGQVNTYHRRKATTFASGYEDLKDKLRSCLKMAADGSAYLKVSAPC